MHAEHSTNGLGETAIAGQEGHSNLWLVHHDTTVGQRLEIRHRAIIVMGQRLDRPDRRKHVIAHIRFLLTQPLSRDNV